MRLEQEKRLVEYNRRKEQELKNLNKQVTKRDDMIERKPEEQSNNYLSPAVAGTRHACRAGEKSHLHVYTRDMLLQRLYGAQKTKISWSLLVRHLYTRQLACKPQTGSLTYF